jgi:N utilization substance protein B
MRRQAREVALQTLFQLDFSPNTAVQDLLNLMGESFDESTLSYAIKLVGGVRDNRDRIDRAVQSASPRWKLDRMAAVDRNLLRVAAFEMFFSDEIIKPNIAINEAVEISKIYGTAESSAFINGILDQMAREKGQ